MNVLRRTAALFAATLLLPAALVAQKQTLLVLSKADHTLAAVEPLTWKVLWKAPVGDDPHEVIANTDGSLAWVSNYGSGSLHTLAVIDLIAHKALPSVDLGNLHGPHGLDFVDGMLWFTAENPNVVASLDPGNNKVDTVLKTGQQRTHMVWVSQTGTVIVATNTGSGSVSIFENQVSTDNPGHYDWIPHTVKVGEGAEGFDISPDRKEVWVANAKPGTISIVDLRAKQVLETIEAHVEGANRLQFTPDGNFVLVTSLSQPDVTVLDAHTHKVVRRIPVGHGAAGLLIGPKGNHAFASCTPDNYVAVIDLHEWKVVAHIDAGGSPDGLAMAVVH